MSYVIKNIKKTLKFSPCCQEDYALQYTIKKEGCALIEEPLKVIQ